MAEAKKLVIQFATIIGLWIIAHFVWARFVKPYAPKFRDPKGKGCQQAQFKYNSYFL